ncbi:hypothetical protein JG687_00004465 [Phytophthora cactorum]|uniref:Uncharacterized protein n=1 Tax=Phytophthora cactorum TaxID=29920 RepID=A0A8T1UNP4_9STRA|nr:hypothetical protein JG687_00004465 [Phytophthora cactorum]
MTRKSAKRTQSLSGVATSTHKRPRVLPGGSSADTVRADDNAQHPTACNYTLSSSITLTNSLKLVEVVPASCPAHPAALGAIVKRPASISEKVVTGDCSNTQLLDEIDDILSSPSENESAPLVGFGWSETDFSAPETSNVGARPNRVSNWTVKHPGKVIPPTSNDYESWTVMQLRKECTERKLQLTRTTSKQDQIRHLWSYDVTKRSVQATVDEENLLDPGL